MQCCTVFLHCRKNLEKGWATVLNISCSLILLFSTDELQITPNGVELQNIIDLDIISHCFPDMSWASAFRMDMSFVFLRTVMAKIIFNQDLYGEFVMSEKIIERTSALQNWSSYHILNDATVMSHIILKSKFILHNLWGSQKK